MKTDYARLEFDRVLEVVRTLAGSAGGADLVSALEPASDRSTSVRLADETLEAAALLAAGSGMPGGSVDPLFDALRPIDAGSIAVEPGVMRALAEALESLSAFRDGLDRTGIEWKEGALAQLLLDLPVLPQLTRHLIRITTPSGTVAPDASTLLSKLARTSASMRESLSREAARISERMTAAGVSRDAPPTIRDGRIVIPVVASRRGALPGMVHDRSDTGGTLFIEPAELLEAGNRLQETLMEMQQEERRILREATAMLREKAGDIRLGAEASVRLDAIFARARFHREAGTTFPLEGGVDLRSVRHPLIPKAESVHNDICLPPDWRVLVISGPNAGGKTVLVKTLGLAVCCSQSGLGACAAPGSSLPHFSRILVSIGDRQSLQERLSTYSARLRDEMEMLRLADEGTLAIIDEPAGGTDPLTGSALAAVLLESLADSGARVVTTTHLGQLKSLASSHPGFYNACMNFDDVELSPDYKFKFGLPGSSFTFEIAGRMGFPEALLERAAGLSQDAFRLDRLIAQLDSEVNALEQERSEARLMAERASRLGAEFEELLVMQKEDADRQQREAARKAEDLLRELNSRADSMLSRLRSQDPDERKAARRAIRELSEALPEPPSETVCDEPHGDRSVIGPGDSVTVPGWKGSGIVEEVRGDGAVVRFGALRVEKRLDELSRSSGEGSKPHDSPAAYTLTPVSSEIDMRGMSAEEALGELDLRIDSCLVAGLSRLRIIHGKGKGVLMKAVIEFLKRDRRVKSHSTAEPHEGGTGVTIAILREPR